MSNYQRYYDTNARSRVIGREVGTKPALTCNENLSYWPKNKHKTEEEEFAIKIYYAKFPASDLAAAPLVSDSSRWW